MKIDIIRILGLFSLFYLVFTGVSVYAADPYFEIEAENADLEEVSVQSSPDASNGEYVYMEGSGSISFDVEVSEPGFYNLNMSVSTPMGNKVQDLYLNGSKISDLSFPESDAFFDFDGGNLPLDAGTNNVEIKAVWGWMYFDCFSLTQVPAHDYSITDPTLIDPDATPEAQDVYNFLNSNYGTNIISGQTSYWDELIGIAGKTPVVRAFDMQNYSPHNPWGNGATEWEGWDDGTVQKAIDWYNSTEGKGIVSFQWHWFSPSGGSLGTSTFYTENTEFDVSQVFNTSSSEYQGLIRDIDTIAAQLKRLDNQNIPVLWRPLHEAGGGWFWWGAQGADACLELYDVMYQRLTQHHGLHNLIWVWSTPEEEWYPGNDKVDIFGYDSYPGEMNYTVQKSIFDQLYNICGGEKIIAMTENGPIPDIDECITSDAMWSYFSSWVDLVSSQNSEAHIQEVYAHENVLTLDEVANVGTEHNSCFVQRVRDEKGFRVKLDRKNMRLVVNTGVKEDRSCEIIITNLKGERVDPKRDILSGTNSSSVDISGLAPGVYTLRVNQEAEVFILPE